jgi:hypothetical protein
LFYAFFLSYEIASSGWLALTLPAPSRSKRKN